MCDLRTANMTFRGAYQELPPGRLQPISGGWHSQRSASHILTIGFKITRLTWQWNQGWDSLPAFLPYSSINTLAPTALTVDSLLWLGHAHLYGKNGKGKQQWLLAFSTDPALIHNAFLSCLVQTVPWRSERLGAVQLRAIHLANNSSTLSPAEPPGQTTVQLRVSQGPARPNPHHCPQHGTALQGLYPEYECHMSTKGTVKILTVFREVLAHGKAKAQTTSYYSCSWTLLSLRRSCLHKKTSCAHKQHTGFNTSMLPLCSPTPEKSSSWTPHSSEEHFWASK